MKEAGPAVNKAWAIFILEDLAQGSQLNVQFCRAEKTTEIMAALVPSPRLFAGASLTWGHEWLL